MRQSLSELWQYRGLGLSFARRDFQVRYAQTFLGPIWALVQPLLSLGVLYLVFQSALKADTSGIPFLSYTLSGLIFWGFFSYNLSQGASALIQARSMLQKIYFPRILLVLSKGLVALVDLGFVVLLFAIVAFADLRFDFQTIFFFLTALLLSFISSQGMAFWLAALSIRFRDLQQLIPFLVQMLFFLSPIAYSAQLWTDSLGAANQFWLYLNPMTSILEIWRWGIFGLEPNLHLTYLLLAGAWCLFLFLSGWWYFQRVERKMADLL